MTNTTPYITYLEQPELILQADVEVFHHWVEQYPYVPIFRVLLAAKYQSLDHSDAAKYLEEAAFFVQDRKQLKHLLRAWNERFILSQQSASQEDTLPQIEAESNSTSEEKSFIPPLEKDQVLEEFVSEETDEHLLSKNEEQELSEMLPNGVHTENVISGEIEVSEEVIEEKETSEIPEQNFLENDILPDDENSTPIEEKELSEVATEENQIEEPISEEVIEEVSTEEVEAPQEIFIEQFVYSETTIVSLPTEEEVEEAPTDDDDIEFLKSIGKYEEPEYETIEDKEWELSSPSDEIPIIDENSIIDAGLVDTDISWLAPWIEEISLEYVKTPTPKEQKQEAPVEKISEAKENIEVKPNVETPSNVEDKSTLKEKAKEEKQSSTEEKSASIISSAHSFDEWLSILEQKKQQSPDAPVFDLPSPEVFSKEEMQSEDLKNEMEAIQAPKEKSDSEGAVKKLAAESVSFKKDMATETLAKLYIRQGKNDLAIAIYHQLMNKFPEKSSYFADQINLLK